MKKRAPQRATHRGPEFKGVVKKITGALTNQPELEQEGRAEMIGRKRTGAKRTPPKLNPDPHRRG
jgi:hypothetical protein